MKLLIILPRFPYPIEKGDKLRAFNQLKILSRAHDITLFALSHEDIKESYYREVKQYCSSIIIYRLTLPRVMLNLIKALFNGKPLQTGYYNSNKAKKLLEKLVRETKPDHIYCQLLRTAEYAINIPINKTLDYQDVFSKGVERRIPSANFLMKILFKIEYRRLLKYEAWLFDKFQNKTIISKPDRDLIPHEKRDEIEIIPNGVDQEYFKPEKIKLTSELVFTGNMGYPPNINCAEFLVKKVLPIIHEKYPATRLTIAGASPHNRVKTLATDKVIVTGWVEDIRPNYNGAKIFLAPMQLGTGLQNKLLEAMSMQLPCITSTLCNSALMAKQGIDILIGDTAEEVAEQTIKLLDDTNLARKIALNGSNFVRDNYTWESATNKLIKLIESSSYKS